MGNIEIEVWGGSGRREEEEEEEEEEQQQQQQQQPGAPPLSRTVPLTLIIKSSLNIMY